MKLVRLPRSPSLRERRPAGGKNHRHIETRGVHHRRRCVPGADDHVDHDDLWLSRNHGIALSHAYRDKLMGNRDRFGMLLAFGGELRQAVDDRPKVGATIAKEILDPPCAQNFQISLAHGFHRNRHCLFHLHNRYSSIP